MLLLFCVEKVTYTLCELLYDFLNVLILLVQHFGQLLLFFKHAFILSFMYNATHF